MIYSNFRGLQLSRLGFGTMRLPENPDGSIDEAATKEMVDYALAHGINYFDTAYPYHEGMSEVVIGKLLAAYPREAYYLATKYPGHQTADHYDPAEIFEEQLKKCGVEYFDFYLLHNVCESSLPVYEDPRWGILDYFLEQKRLGRIRHLGFSSHGQPEMLRQFLDAHGKDMEFCQIQLNYLDWSLQKAKEKYDLLTERGIPIWVMEPLRGGRLAALPAAAQETLRALDPAATDCEWAFRWLQGLDNVAVVLSGMSAPEQMRQNIATFDTERKLTEQENAALYAIAETMKDSVPCTGCRYCCDGCPMGLDIPMLLSTYNEILFQPTAMVSMRLEMLPEDKLPSACLGCGACAQICPQKIDIPTALADLNERWSKMTKWSEICRARAEAAARNKQKQQPQAE